ncbi:hypothetical protein PY093_18370 [Cytobacillus sp. S13-E01]|uniref:hypothetical protein n=1 Tax=Cytobacillus sp. S13-E01 TaxID=3031326 RepID=UPI0023D7BC15|nr:hypothetical protein [Cytobacillus sp. S13-E01]MDF0728604.1 hypothetical protein [Cytobacillus sp. S13-E01]
MEDKKDEIIEEIKSDVTVTDPFSRLMFGPNKRSQSQSTPDQPQQNTQVDYYQLMQQFDEIMGSVNRIKPIVKEFTPLLNFFKKK